MIGIPTAAKLVAGIGFAITAVIANYFYYVSLDAVSFTLGEILAVAGTLGFLLGWIFLGSAPGYGGFDSLWAGFRAAVYAVVVACLIFGLLVVARGLMNGSYLDPLLPLKDWLRHSLDFLVTANQKEILITIGLGALITGRLAGISYVRWQ